MYKICALIFSLLCFHEVAVAGTYYVSADGSNFSSGKSNAPWKTIEHALRKIDSGDTLVIKDGTYQESLYGIPNGMPHNYTTIKAENDGKVVIKRPFKLQHTNAYIQFEGIKFDYPACKHVMGNHIKFLRCSFVGGAPSGNEVNLGIGTNDFNDTQYVLIEDSWVYGAGGRYKILIYNSDRIVLRRVVVRDDAGWTTTNSDPEAGIAVYESSNVSVQNAIVIDSNLSTYHKNNVGAFYLTGHRGHRPSHNVEFLGCMAINNKNEGWHVDTDDGAVGLTLRDIVIYGQRCGIAQSNTSVAMDIERLTLGDTQEMGIGNWGKKTNTIRNSVFFNLAKGTSKGANAITYSNTFKPADLSGIGVMHINPLTNGLKYLPRIEKGSKLKSAGNGGQMGAQIEQKIGVAGTLWGEPGYSMITNDPLWSWPHEIRLRKEMCENTSRGFCKKGAEFTTYIWTYLGSAAPAFPQVSTGGH